jgi:L-asparaginase II
MSDRPASVRVVRSGVAESEHLVHVAVADDAGTLVASAGDPRRIVFARSCMKPLQAAVSLSLMDLRPTDRQVAIMCASHNGEGIHVRTVRGLLRAGGLDESALRNTPGWPLDPVAAARAGRPSRIRQNCSGKHAGMLVATAHAGWRVDAYLRPSHPLQRRITRAVLLATGLDGVEVGVDGCGLPVHAMPLASMATLFARLTRPERLGDLAPHAEMATSAMRAHPYLVAGRKREDTEIMRAAGSLVVKSGAEALMCAAHVDAGIGVAVRVADGGDRAAAPALLHALGLLGMLSAKQLKALDRFAHPWVTGGGAHVGELVPAFGLRRR